MSVPTSSKALRIIVALVAIILVAPPGGVSQTPRFEVTVVPSAHPGPLTGRLVLILADEVRPEPRLTLAPHGPAIFGLDLGRLAPGDVAGVDSTTLGYPAELAALPPGDYYAQGVINVYDRVEQADGHTLWLPMTNGRVSFFTVEAGNLYSEPVPVSIGQGGAVRITVVGDPRGGSPGGHRVAAARQHPERKVVDVLGRPIYIHATVLLPRGYADDPDVGYPSVYALGHSVPFSFSPDSSRARNIGRAPQPELLRRRVDPAARSHRLPQLPPHRHLRRRERLSRFRWAA
jgi:hypothetical protein